MWPDQPGQPHAAGLFQRRTILAYACVAVTAVIIIVLASVIGFASTPGPVTAAPAALSVVTHSNVSAPPAGSHRASPGANPGQQPG